MISMAKRRYLIVLSFCKIKLGGNPMAELYVYFTSWLKLMANKGHAILQFYHHAS